MCVDRSASCQLCEDGNECIDINAMACERYAFSNLSQWRRSWECRGCGHPLANFLGKFG